MTPVPLELPLRPSEAAELGNLIFDHAERKALTAEVRNRIAARGAAMRLETVQPYFGSIERDPVHPSAYYLAVDGEKGEPLLLHLALATAPTSSIFYKPLLIGRMRRANGPEMVINAVPFGPSDCENLDKFCARVGAAFLPRPQGSRASIAIAGDPPEAILPTAFEEFRAVLKRTGRNLAATNCTGSGRSFYYAGLWAAIRAGWRDGYSAAAEIVVDSESLDSVQELIREAAASSIFRVNPAALVGGQQAFEASFDSQERSSILEEFSRPFDLGDARYEFAPEEIGRLAARFGPALRAAERVHERIRQARASSKAGRSFDLELSLEGSGSITTAAELLFCLDWLKWRGHAAQLVAPDLGQAVPGGQHLKELAGIARHFHATLSLAAQDNHTPEVLSAIAKATVGRVQYRVAVTGTNVRERIGEIAEHLAG